jgi:hypothetical protein
MREMSVAQQRYEAVRAVIADGETVTLELPKPEAGPPRPVVDVEAHRAQMRMWLDTLDRLILGLLLFVICDHRSRMSAR